jgi:tRNA (cytosine34-C5)-methyltransferase
MAGGIRRKKNNPAKKRDKRLGPIQYDAEGKMVDDRNTEAGAKLNYKDVVRQNDKFEAYYRGLGMCPEDEATQMMAVLKTDLPASFRITGTRAQAAALLRIIRSEYFAELTAAKAEGGEVVVPAELPWYPHHLAYQLNVTRKDIRRQEIYFRLHNFLVAETESGAISRQVIRD